MVCRFGVAEPKMKKKDGRSLDHLTSLLVIFGPSFDHLKSFFVIFGSVTNHLTSFFCHFWLGDQPWFVTEPKITKNDVRWSDDRPSFVIFGSVTNHLTSFWI